MTNEFYFCLTNMLDSNDEVDELPPLFLIPSRFPVLTQWSTDTSRLRELHSNSSFCSSDDHLSSN
jgi:hypothetical protein